MHLETTSVTQWLAVGSTLTVSESSTATSVTSTASTSAVTSTAVSNVRSERSSVKSLQFGWNGLVSLSHNLAQVSTQFGVVVGEQRHSSTRGTGSASSSDSVNVILNVSWHVVVDHVGDTLDICHVSINPSAPSLV